MTQRSIRVVVVDDSAPARRRVLEALSGDPGIDVVAATGDPQEGRDQVLAQKPDVMVLSLGRSRVDGVEFIRELLPEHPLPVVVASGSTAQSKRLALEALAAGAVDFVAKPPSQAVQGWGAMLMELRTKIKIASTVNLTQVGRLGGAARKDADGGEAPSNSSDMVIAIGASVGGPEAIREVLSGLPAGTPGVVIVQHMPAGFTAMFAERLNATCPMTVREAADDDPVVPGTALVAPGGNQMRLARSQDGYKVRCSPGRNVCGHCPSVEVLMQSVAEHAGSKAIGVVLTGMGSDGADGMVALRRAGARTVAQNKATCAVFGMPETAHARGGVERLLPLSDIAPAVVEMITGEGD